MNFGQGMNGMGGMGLDQLLKMLGGGSQQGEATLAGLLGVAPAMLLKEQHKKQEEESKKKKEQKSLEDMLMSFSAQGAMPGGGMDLGSLLGLFGSLK